VDESADDGRRVVVWPHASVEVASRADALVMRVQGEVDIANVAVVEEAAIEAVAQAHPSAVVLDLEAVRYLDGAARTWLHRLGSRLTLAGIALEVRRPVAGAAARMFDLVWPAPAIPGGSVPPCDG
jgi:anti-anti-sigma factor